MILAMTTTETRSSWSDWRLDGLREKVDRDLARQDEHVRELRREVNEFIRQRPSVLARWGLRSLPRQSSPQVVTAKSPRESSPPSGLSWSDGRIDDLQSELENFSTQLDGDIDEIKEEMRSHREEISDRRFRRQMLTLYFLWAVILALAWLSVIVAAIQAD
jgi:hypothetical protein